MFGFKPNFHIVYLGGPSRAQWEDVTGSTPLTFVNDCVSFTTTVSARFWLMDCRNISDATKMATELYRYVTHDHLILAAVNRKKKKNINLGFVVAMNREAIHVPFMAKFVVFAKRIDPLEARLRVFCMTDDKEDKTLEYQEHFTEVAKSRDVEVLEGKPQYTEFAGNLIPVTKSGEQLHIPFKAFRENRLPFNVRVKDQHADTVGRALFMREPRVAKGEPPQQPICILNIVLPEQIIPDHISILSDNRDVITRIDVSKFTRSAPSNTLTDLRIVDVSNLLGEDWIPLAAELGITEAEVNDIVAENPTSTPRQAQSMLREYIKRKDSNRAALENALRTIKRDDIVTKCIIISGYGALGKPVTSVRKHGSLDNGYEEPDIMKDSESVEELVNRDRDELKYSAEEKIVEDSDEEPDEDETVKRSVAERREQIQKRLSIERQIPASTQKKEIVQEIVEIKRHSLIEDKKAMHEEEIILHAPTDNIIKSAVIPDQVIKLKSTINDEIDISKTDFDKELQDKFKTTIKDLDAFEHRPSDEVSKQEIFRQESSEKQGDTKIQYDSTVTEKSYKDHGDETLPRDTVTEVRTTITTVHTTSHPTDGENNKTIVTTERIVERSGNNIEDTRKFLEQEQELFSAPIRVQPGQEQESFSVPIRVQPDLHSETSQIRQTITATKDFLDGEQTGHFVTDYIVEEAKDSDVIDHSVTAADTADTSVVQELTDFEVISSPNTSKITTRTSNIPVRIKVSKDVFQADTDSDEFYKTIEEKITKKMSHDFSTNKDDIITQGL